MIKWIRTSRLSTQNSLSYQQCTSLRRGPRTPPRTCSPSTHRSPMQSLSSKGTPCRFPTPSCLCRSLLRTPHNHLPTSRPCTPPRTGSPSTHRSPMQRLSAKGTPCRLPSPSWSCTSLPRRPRTPRCPNRRPCTRCCTRSPSSRHFPTQSSNSKGNHSNSTPPPSPCRSLPRTPCTAPRRRPCTPQCTCSPSTHRPQTTHILCDKGIPCSFPSPAWPCRSL